MSLQSAKNIVDAIDKTRFDVVLLGIEDHARALHMVVTEGKAGETYNIGGHNEKKNLDVVFTICDLL
ncbi:hypothetical protein MJL33_34530, partial [Salmonella enterica subsp. enterica serovar Kentucky]|nr:hypothetical protein [Salmonella enterica subsp. enterica serovar Kentucky]